MKSLRYIFAVVFLAAGCRVEEIDPPVPEGTVFTGDAAYAGGDTTDTCTGCGGGGVIDAGFRATVVRDDQAIDLQAGEANVVVGSSNGFTTLSAQLLDGNSRVYQLSFIFNSSPGQYALVAWRDWAAGDIFTTASFQYSEAVSSGAAPDLNDGGDGSLTVLTTTSRLSGSFEGNALLDDQSIPMSGEFNVPAQ